LQKWIWSQHVISLSAIKPGFILYFGIVCMCICTVGACSIYVCTFRGIAVCDSSGGGVTCLRSNRHSDYKDGLVACPAVPSASEWGWTKVAENFWPPLWSDIHEAAIVCNELVRCNCKKRYAGNCKCCRTNLKCTQLCFCSGQCTRNHDA
jgi:hypothetical protein